MSSKIRGVAPLPFLPEIKNGMEQNKPEYKELFCVFGVSSRSLFMSDCGNRSKTRGGKLDG